MSFDQFALYDRVARVGSGPVANLFRTASKVASIFFFFLFSLLFSFLLIFPFEHDDAGDNRFGIYDPLAPFRGLCN